MAKYMQVKTTEPDPNTGPEVRALFMHHGPIP